MAKNKKAFTLIEMLIVIVIIGILAAALVPRLISVQGRARDTKRKADLSQLGTALAIYKTDNSTFPVASGSTAKLVPVLSGYMTAVPVDPSADASTVLVPELNSATGYGYYSIMRNSVTANGAILGADTESDGSSSNAIIYTGTVTHSTDVATAFEALISTCGGKATKGAAFNSTTCVAPISGMRYYYAE